MKILIIGRNEVLYNTALFLSKHFQICGIITAPAAPEYQKKERHFELLSKRLGCPFILAQNINKNVIKFIKNVKPDIGISVNWVSLIQKNVLKLIPYGILNSHPGQLPKFKGNAATNWAIILGAKNIGFAIHYMKADELDAGDLLIQEKIPISVNTTIKHINDIWGKTAPSMFLQAIKGVQDGSIQSVPQINLGTRGFRCYPRLPMDGKIDWSKSAAEIHNLIRASTKPYSGAYSYMKINGRIKKIYIWESRIVAPKTLDIGIPGHVVLNDIMAGEAHVFCGKGILALKLVQYDGEAEFMPGRVWKSIRMRLSIDVEQELAHVCQLLRQYRAKI